MSVIHLSDENFKKEVLDSHLPVVVDFWAPWCGPCKMLGPVIEGLANEYEGRVKVTKINIDENSKVAAQYGIMSIPTIIFFKKGRVMEQAAGAINQRELRRKIENNL